MCFATAALIAGAVGAGVTAGGTIAGGQATSNASNYAAQVAANNKVIADQNAEYSIQAGEAQAAATSMKGAATSGKIKAVQAASGLDVNTGSAVDVQTSAREQEKLDTETVMNNAELQAYGYRSQGIGFQAQSELDKLTGKQAKTGSYISAAGGLLSSASGIGLKWGQLGGVGGGGGSGNYGGSPEDNPFLRPI